MSGGSGDSGDGGGVRGDGGARGAVPPEPQTQGSLEAPTPVLSPRSAVRRALGAAVGGGTEAGGAFSTGTGTRELWPSAACCGCTAEGAGGGWRTALGAAGGTHPELRGLQHCCCAGPFAEEGCNCGI